MKTNLKRAFLAVLIVVLGTIAVECILSLFIQSSGGSEVGYYYFRLSTMIAIATAVIVFFCAPKEKTEEKEAEQDKTQADA